MSLHIQTHVLRPYDGEPINGSAVDSAAGLVSIALDKDTAEKVRFALPIPRTLSSYHHITITPSAVGDAAGDVALQVRWGSYANGDTLPISTVDLSNGSDDVIFSVLENPKVIKCSDATFRIFPADGEAVAGEMLLIEVERSADNAEDVLDDDLHLITVEVQLVISQEV